MKYFYSFFLSLFLLSNAGFAQSGDREKQIEALRVAFITKQLDLSPDEAKQFWPVQDNYQKEAKKLAEENRKNNGDPLEFEQKMLDLRKRYKSEFLKVISEEKFNKLMRADRDFKEIIRKELEKRRQNMPPNRKGGQGPPNRNQ